MSSSIREQLQIALSDFATRPLRDAATALLSTLGYESSRVLRFDSLEELPNTVTLADVKVDIKSFSGLFQLTSDEVRSSGQVRLFNAGRFENSIVESYVFVALELTKADHTRTELAKITRAFNKSFKIPVFVIFKHGNTISLSVTRRRLNKRDDTKDVLEKVTIIKDIRLEDPHQAHVRILEDLHLPKLLAGKVITEFVQLEQMWAKVLDIEELNKKFYKELSGWFYWAFDHANISFPNEKTVKTDKERDEIRQINLIRLITRLIFTWFLKEKNLVPEELFEPNKLKGILKNFEKLEEVGSNYYQSILQNLFFATLNNPMLRDDPSLRVFVPDGTFNENRDSHLVNGYRYKDTFQNPDSIIALFDKIPFLNGGLFERLDHRTEDEKATKYIDGFSREKKNRATVPNALFFADNQNADLSKHLGTKFKNAKVRGILEILNGYKFTVTENTPIEEEVALDPELLGKVFENLLAAYNPETEETARKQTGSFYTPRDVVDFMVDESLIAYLHHALTGGQPVMNGVSTGEQPSMLMPENDPNLLLTPNVQAGDKDPLEERLRRLFSYSTEYKPEFSGNQISKLITAIDTAKILDPACGSGAFPMGVLQKLVFVLGRLDPNNKRWKEQQRERSIGEKITEIKQDLATAQKLNDSEIRDQAIKSLEGRLQDIERAFDASTTDFDYARKLFLIENCIYGVDIQPIAVQIAKLRCFISLVIDQKVDDHKENRGIIPLPNLETKFVAANSLIPVPDLIPAEINQLEEDLVEIRHAHFRARNYPEKKSLRKKDAQIRREIVNILKKLKFPDDMAQSLAAFDPYSQNSSAPFFDPHWMFGLKIGFDIVIGNPPYKIVDSKVFKNIYGSNYPLMQGKPDLFRAFIEISPKILNSNGLVSYIIPNTFLTIPSAEKLRKFILNKFSLQLICNFDYSVFPEAEVNSIIFQFGKINRYNNTKIYHFTVEGQTHHAEGDFQFISQTEWKYSEFNTINIFSNSNKDIIDAIILSSNKKLSEICEIILGAQVYHNSIHSKEEMKSKFLHSSIQRSKYLLELSGKNIDHLFVKLPTIREYVDYFNPKTYNNLPETFTKSKRIIVREIPSDRIFAAYTEDNFTVNKSCYVLKIRDKLVKYKSLVAILNSRVLGFFVFNMGDKANQNIFPRISMKTLKSLPIPKLSSITENLLTNLVNGILHLTSNGNHHAVMVAYLEQLIDALVYELYLPDILHAANRHPEKVIGADPPPEEPTLEHLQAYYERVYDPKHEIRKLVFYLDSIPEVRIIEGKQ